MSGGHGSPPRAGALVAWWNEGELSLAVVAGEEKRRVSLVDDAGRVRRVTAGRLAFVVEREGEVPERTPESLARAGRRAAEATRRVRDAARDCDAALLWELVRDEPQSFSPAALAALAFGTDAGEQRAAVVLALRHDRVHFARKGDGWEPRDPEAVEQLRHQRRTEARRLREREALHAALAAAAAGGRFVANGSETEARTLEALEQVAVDQDRAEPPARELARDALAAAGLNPDPPAAAPAAAFRLLRRLGRFSSDDENLQIVRFGLRVPFPDAVSEAAARAAAAGFDPGARADLTHLCMLTIDSAHTREIDDGLTWEPRGAGRARIGVHIADPTDFVQPGDAVDREALARGVTHYLPEQRLPMLPAPISEEAASLVPGAPRPALSFLVELDAEGEIARYDVQRSVVRSRARLSYDEADRPGAGEHAELLAGLAAAAAACERRRLRGGAVGIRAPEVDPHVDRDGRITLERHAADSVARGLVRESMILAGQIAADFCRRRELPAIHRRQAPPERPPETPPQDLPAAVRAYRLRRAMRRAEVGLEPGPHYGLGLAAYAQATSPLRRFQDLATHRQIRSALLGEPAAYDAAELQRIAATTERAEVEARQAERASDRYWLLRYLEQQGETELWGRVLAARPRPWILLEETLLEVAVPSLGEAEPGRRLRLAIERLDPRADLLRLRPVAAEGRGK